MPKHPTLSLPIRHEEPPIRGSRFIGHAAPVASEEAATEVVRALRTEFPDASHHCFAWRLQDGDRGFRAFDDGEPGGTAGQPILTRIDSAGLRGVVVVVVRYFGGTKLGKGGLIRAYGGTAAATLNAGEIVEIWETLPLRIVLDYRDQGAVRGVLHHLDLTPASEAFDARIVLEVHPRVEDIEALRTQLRDRTAGRVNAEPL